MTDAHPAQRATERHADEILIRECIEGSQPAWSALIDKYRNLIFSIPVKFGFSRDDAADIFQNVCMKLMSELSKIREPKTLAAWLIQVTAHECFRRRRKLASHGTLSLDGQYSFLATCEKLPDVVIEELGREQILRETISEAPERCKQLIDLLFYTVPPQPYELVARELGLATGSIGFVRMRCLERLRKQLEQRGFR
jgi:RNA polymerase sigma factor (sigma-70 family)